jgi:hypothetical protein
MNRDDGGNEANIDKRWLLYYHRWVDKKRLYAKNQELKIENAIDEMEKIFKSNVKDKQKTKTRYSLLDW